MTTFPVHSGDTAPEASLPQLLAVPPQGTFDGTWPFEARYTEGEILSIWCVINCRTGWKLARYPCGADRRLRQNIVTVRMPNLRRCDRTSLPEFVRTGGKCLQLQGARINIRGVNSASTIGNVEIRKKIAETPRMNSYRNHCITSCLQ